MAGSCTVEWQWKSLSLQEINHLRTVPTQTVIEAEGNPTLAGTEATEVEDDDHTVHVVCWEQDSLQEETRICNELIQVQISNLKDCSGLKSSRDNKGSHLNQMTDIEASEDSLDMPQERRTEETPAQLQDKARHTHFLGFSSAVGSVLPGEKELHRRSAVLEQVQVKNHGISSVPLCSRAARES